MVFKIFVFFCFLGLFYPNVSLAVIATIILFLIIATLERGNREFKENQERIKANKQK